MKKNLNMKLTISGQRSDELVSIQVMDTNSRLNFLEIQVSKEEFAKALFGCANIDVNCVHFDDIKIKNIGKYLIQKTIEVEVTNFGFMFREHEEKINKLIDIKKEELGLSDWKIWSNGCNTKRINRDDKIFIRVVLCKYVDEDPNKSKNNIGD